MKKKIYFVLPGITFGGAERVIFTILNHVDYSKFEPTLVLFKKDGMPLHSLNSEVTILELNIERIRFAIFKLLVILWTKKPDIVFMGWGEIAAFLSPFIPFFGKTKFIARETNIVSQHVTRKEILFFYRFYNNYDVIIAQSNDMEQDLLQNMGIKKEKIVKINNPIDLEKIDLQLKGNQEICFDSTQKNVVAVGNLSYRKGFDNLLKVFSYLKNESIHLYIIGDGPQKEEFLALKEKLDLGKVDFLGIKTNPYPFMQQADLFVLSSRYEGFPNVLLEAGACETYVLANHCKGGINEIIVDKINGEISPIENHKEFANKIKQILSSNKDKIAIKNSISNRYSKEIILKKYMKLLTAL